MRKGTIKAAVLAAVFIGAVLIFGRFMNDTNEDLTTEMKEIGRASCRERV